MNRQQAIKNAVVALSLLLNGGKGSGNWGHMGRPGKRGGAMIRVLKAGWTKMLHAGASWIVRTTWRTSRKLS